jgi:hypothetical protein
LARPLLDRLAQGIDSVEDAFGSTGELEKDVNVVFFETAANFCFWSENPDEKWQVKSGGEKFGGWYGLARAFDKAIRRGIPVYDAEYMADLTVKQASRIFAGAKDTQIPLLAQRANNIVEAAEFLNESYGGSAKKFVESCRMSAPAIAYAVASSLPSYRDGAQYHGRWAWILKRAQILPSDLSQLGSKYPDFRITDTDKLTIFADYRLPQILRHFGVLRYSDGLARRVDRKRIIPSQSAAEVEIRMATINACEQLKSYLPGRSSADIDLGLWLLSQDMRNYPGLKPHHLTPGIFY